MTSAPPAAAPLSPGVSMADFEMVCNERDFALKDLAATKELLARAETVIACRLGDRSKGLVQPVGFYTYSARPHQIDEWWDDACTRQRARLREGKSARLREATEEGR